jgi:hypothetical protein
MAEHESAHSPQHCNRRQALQGAAAVGALALPAGVVAMAAGKIVSVPNYGTDPLIAMWQERQAAKAAADAAEDGPDEDELGDRYINIEARIAKTTPVSPEGLAIVATVLLVWSRDGSLPKDVASVTVSQYILSTAPADVLRRAGLEV